MKDINTYQKWTRSTAIYEDNLYPVLGLAEEAGEVCGKVAKLIRDDTDKKKLREDLKKELGDVAWMLCRIADDQSIRMSDILQLNRDKLTSRKEREMIGGSGDDR